MNAILSNKMMVQWKGEKGEYFHAKKGIRQGDLLSLYLFVLSIGKLSHMILDSVEQKK